MQVHKYNRILICDNIINVTKTVRELGQDYCFFLLYNYDIQIICWGYKLSSITFFVCYDTMLNIYQSGITVALITKHAIITVMEWLE